MVYTQQDIFYQVLCLQMWGMVRPVVYPNMPCNKAWYMDSLRCYSLIPFSVFQLAIFLQVYYNVF
jgi:hypothetical protein